MTSNDVDVVAARCPYCQGMELTRLDESNAMPIDVFRCHGCGTRSTSAACAKTAASRRTSRCPQGSKIASRHCRRPRVTPATDGL